MQPHGSKTSPIYFLLGRCQHECCSCSTDLQLVGVRPSSCLDGCHVRYLWLHKATSPDFLKNLTMAVLFFFFESFAGLTKLHSCMYIHSLFRLGGFMGYDPGATPRTDHLFH